MSLLRLAQVEAFYGASQALFDVNIELAEGECVALMGRNGMGKSTTVKTICRLLASAQGQLEFAGHDLRGLASHQVARLGIGLVPEGRRCFRGLTVGENLLAAARPGPWDLAEVVGLFPRLAERRGQLAGLLSGGEQQMLAIGRALMTNPRLLILDEATEGLAPMVRQEIWHVIGTLRQQTGMAILVIDKSLVELRSVADRAVILDKGVSVWNGPFDELSRALAARHLGI